MKVTSEADITADFGAYLKASEQGPVVVTRRGKPVAVLLAAGDEDELERLLMGHSPELQAILEAARKRFREGAGIPHDEFWKAFEAKTPGTSKRRSVLRKKNKS